MENIRVNKISVNVSIKDDETVITLYKTNQPLGNITTDDLDIEPFSECGVSLKAYQAYCRDYMINLIDNGGIEGYYYEPKAESESVKYDVSAFKSKCKEYIDMVIGENYDVNILNEEIISIEQYKDNFIKNIQAYIIVSLPQYDIKFKLLAEVKSGQMCRPRTILYNNSEYSFNITNINKIIKTSEG